MNSYLLVLPLILVVLLVFVNTSVLPAVGQTYAKDGNQIGKDIILDKPSDITKSNYKIDPVQEKLVREKQKILVNALLDEEEKYGGFKNRPQHLPWTGIGYDYVNNSLEITILTEYFKTDALPKYIEKIRSIVGNDIDISLSPNGYAEYTEPDGVYKRLSPLKQFKAGIPIGEIQCKENLQLVIKASTGFPACVKSGNKAKLLERGWATKPIQESDRVEITGDDAWAICGALRLPCPSNPVFSGTLLDDNIIIKISGNGDPYEVKLNQTSVCVVSPSKQIECSKR